VAALLLVRSRTLAMPDEASPEHTAILREDHREVLAALACLPARPITQVVLAAASRLRSDHIDS
jgi:hypothetical protein